MTPYLTPETAEALRKALAQLPPPGENASDVVLRRAVLEMLRSLPIVGAVPAEEALETLEGMAKDALRGYWPDVREKVQPQAEVAIATVRHALRAAKAQADAPPPGAIRRGHEAWSWLEAWIDPLDRSAASVPPFPECRTKLAQVLTIMYPLKEETP